MLTDNNTIDPQKANEQALQTIIEITDNRKQLLTAIKNQWDAGKIDNYRDLFARVLEGVVNPTSSIDIGKNVGKHSQSFFVRVIVAQNLAHKIRQNNI